MRVASIDPLVDRRWADLTRLPTAGLFHSPTWIAALKECYGFAPQAYIAIDDADVAQGGIAFCEIDDALGTRIVSLPFSDVCDPLLATPIAWPFLEKRLTEHGLPVTLRVLNESFLNDDRDFAVSKRARWHTLDVRDPLDTLRDRFTAATRRAVAKAERADVLVRPLVGEAELDAFLRLHVRLRKRKYRLLAQPRAFFAAIRGQFQATSSWYPLGAWFGDKLLAATVYLRSGDTLYYKFNASDSDGLSFRPNDLLVWAGILLAKELDLTAVDLGPSDDDQPGLIRFKRGFGATERELRFLKWRPPDAEAGQETELRAVLRETTRFFTAPAVADDVTEAAGAALYGLFA